MARYGQLRLAGDAAELVRPLRLIEAGRDHYRQTRYGDYSWTTLDPVDESFWTVQEYTDSRELEVNDDPIVWATWISRIKRTAVISS